MKPSSSPDPSEEQPESYEPTAEEIALMRAATPAEAAAVDAMILRECSGHFRKVAMVAGRLLNELESAYPHLPLTYVQARMQELEDAGVLEIAGEVWAMRFSEVRLIVPRDET